MNGFSFCWQHCEVTVFLPLDKVLMVEVNLCADHLALEFAKVIMQSACSKQIRYSSVRFMISILINLGYQLVNLTVLCFMFDQFHLLNLILNDICLLLALSHSVR